MVFSSQKSSPQPGFWALVREDFETHGRDLSRPGFRAMFVYRFGRWRLGLRRGLFRKMLAVVYRSMHRYIRNHYGIELHATANIGRRFLIGHQGVVVIHEFATIGDDCSVRQGVTIGAVEAVHFHAPVLGNNVEVAAGAVIVGKVRVGNNVRIGPNCVVMASIPDNSIAVMPPPRIIRSVAPKEKPPRESVSEPQGELAPPVSGMEKAAS
jgi:serine O-acetyltransferase